MTSAQDHPNAAGWLDAVRAAVQRGELLTAHDLAERGLRAFPDDQRLRYHAVLALARAGSTDEAARQYSAYRLAEARDEDSAALGARIAKDVALAARGERRMLAAADAADRYEAVHDRTEGYYSAVNAATMNLVAGRTSRARELALRVRAVLERTAEDSYYAAATSAEALLILGDETGARAELVRAAERAAGDVGATATTRRQLRLVCTLMSIDFDVLEPLTAPTVVHYCGHLIAAPGESGRFPADMEDSVATAIATVVAAVTPGVAFGALACGGDILWAEALLETGSELHVVLPFAVDEFVAVSVASGGAAWVQRFEACLGRARSVTYATDGAYLKDDVLFRYGSELAMGSAILRARDLDGSARQLAVWDGLSARGDAGTAIDMATWRRHGLPSEVVPLPAAGTAATSATKPPISPQPSPRRPRVIRALLFADVTGFSRLSDLQLPAFADAVLPAFARVLATSGEAIEHQNTWGDALYVVLADVVEAAGCALALQQAMGSVDLAGAGLPAGMALRLSGHVGPVFPIHDPVIDRAAFMGAHVSRTARIEPVTPPGIVYVTEEFAAALALRTRHDYRCDYVGHMPTAKDYGRLRMYRLRRRPELLKSAAETGDNT